jgi:hypothetical protein
MLSRLLFLALLAVTCLAPSAIAQDKPAEKKDLPKIILATPLVVSPGVMAKVTLRGLKLDQATEGDFTGLESPPKIELKKKEKSSPPNGLNANEIGDSFVEIEFTLPADFAAGEAALTIKHADGESPPYLLLVRKAVELVTEQEPNESFRKCSPIKPGQTIVGTIHQQRDVDVFVIEAKEGEVLIAETIAARRGSALDTLLSLYDDRGQLLAQSDDQADHRDAVLKFKLPAGKVYLTLMDALDRGSGGHPYLLQLRAE